MSETRDKADRVRAVIRGCTMGTENYWAHPMFRPWVYTDAVKGIAEEAGAYWLIDAILSWQADEKVRGQRRQFWTLELDGKGGAVLRATDGGKMSAPEVELARQEIPYTDFPLPEGVQLWVTGNVLFHPNED
jgi:hypothetical protein